MRKTQSKGQASCRGAPRHELARPICPVVTTVSERRFDVVRSSQNQIFTPSPLCSPHPVTLTAFDFKQSYLR